MSNIQKSNDLSGQVFGKLKVINFSDRSRNGHYRWVCRCECGTEVVVFATHLRRGNTKSCVSCAETGGRFDRRWVGHGELPIIKWYNIVNSAKSGKSRKAIPFEITIEDAWNKFIEQDRMCALTGEQIWFGPTNSRQHEGTASLDRIDSGLGYTKDNIQWVHKDINLMKNKLSQSRFIELCNRVTKHNN